MKILIGLGALVTSSLLFASSANAGSFSRCHCPCQPAPSCSSAATASVQGGTSYSATYQPSDAGSHRATRTTKRWKTWEDYRREIKGW